jgi:hypothetical protein
LDRSKAWKKRPPQFCFLRKYSAELRRLATPYALLMRHS